MTLNPHRRLMCETYDLPLPVGRGIHALKVTLAYDERTKILREIAFVSRGKSGHGLDQLLAELGIRLSRVIQGRDANSGDEMRDEP